MRPSSQTSWAWPRSAVSAVAVSRHLVGSRYKLRRLVISCVKFALNATETGAIVRADDGRFIQLLAGGSAGGVLVLGQQAATPRRRRSVVTICQART